MGVYVEEEWRYKRKSERASKSAFAYKINQKRKSNTSSGKKGSKEVIIKFTKGAKSRAGIREAIKYISGKYELGLYDADGIYQRSKEDIEDTILRMQMNVDLPEEYGLELTKSLVFSPPRVAGISQEDAIALVRKTLTSMYPHNYFVLAYHKNTKNDHVHVVMNMDGNDGKRLQIKGRDFKEMRIKFAENLIAYGYDVKATIKHREPQIELRELKDKRNRNMYEVVDFGLSQYSEHSTTKSVYLAYKTHTGKEVKIWGAELESELSKNKVNIGDKIKLSKIGEVKISVPVIDQDGKILDWKETHRNQWKIENLSHAIEQKIALSNESTEEYCTKTQEIKLNSRERIKAHITSKKEFDHEKNMLLNPEYKQKYEVQQKLKIKQKHTFRF